MADIIERLRLDEAAAALIVFFLVGVIFVIIAVSFFIGLHLLDRWHMRHAARKSYLSAMTQLYGPDPREWPKR